MPPGFDNIINKFKSGTKQAADQMQRAAKVAKLKMDIVALKGDRGKHMQTVGERAFGLFKESNNLDGAVLIERVRHDFNQIERIDGRIKDMENQIEELQALGTSADIVDAQEVSEVEDQSGESGGTQQ